MKTMCGAIALALVVTSFISSDRLAAQAEGDEKVFSLARALNVALANSETLLAVEQDLDIAKQQVREAWASVLPDVRVSASYTRNILQQQFFLPAFFFDPNAAPGEVRAVKVGQDNTWNATLNASQPLFEYTAFIGLGAADRYRDLQVERVRGTAQQVVTIVRLAYFDVLLGQENVSLTEQSIERVEQTLEETRALNRAGFASNYDVLLLEVQLSNLNTTLSRARYALTAGKRMLLVEMGLDPDVQIEVAGRLNEMDLVNPDRNDPANAELLAVSGMSVPQAGDAGRMVQVALQRRTDLRQIRANIVLEEARLEVQRAEYFPKLSLFSNYNVTAQQDGGPVFFGNNPNQRTKLAMAGLQVDIPIFTGFSRDARVRQSRAAVRQGEIRLERAERETLNQLRTLMDSVEEARQRAESQQQAVGQAQRGFEIASAEYNAGIGSRLQTTEAELVLRQSQFNYAQAVYDYLAARANLEAALGTVPDEAGSFAVSGG
jgi:outer membrane protein TolC